MGNNLERATTVSKLKSIISGKSVDIQSIDFATEMKEGLVSLFYGIST